MDLLTVRSTNSNDPECRRMMVIRHFEIPITFDPKVFIAQAIRDTEQELRDQFPRSMNYTVPYTEVEVMPRKVLAIREEERAMAEEVTG